MKRTATVLLRFVLVMTGTVASVFTVRAQTVVDNYSTNQMGANYTLMTANLGAGVPVVSVSGGTLQLENAASYAGYIWNGPGNAGLALTNVGDTVSIQFSVTAGYEGGITLWKTNTPVTNAGQVDAAQLSTARYTTSTEAGATHGLFINTDPTLLTNTIYTALSGAPSGLSTLTIAITDKTATDTTIAFGFSGTGFDPISGTHAFSFIDPIYFGPALYQSTVQFDNLTFTSAIPEPATCAVLAGFAAMVLGLGHRTLGRAKASGFKS